MPNSSFLLLCLANPRIGDYGSTNSLVAYVTDITEDDGPFLTLVIHWKEFKGMIDTYRSQYFYHLFPILVQQLILGSKTYDLHSVGTMPSSFRSVK